MDFTFQLENHFLSDKAALSAFLSFKDALGSSTPLAVSVLPAQSRLKMNQDVITVIYFQSLLATISFYDLSTER